MMTKDELNNLKRRHNALLKEGQALWSQINEKYSVLIQLQKMIESEEGEDYDPLPLIFGDGFFIDDDASGK